MIPEERFSTTPITGTLLNPVSMDRTIGFCWGPVALQDPSQGAMVKIWTVFIEDFTVYIKAADVAPIPIFTRSSKIHNISMAFDLNGNACVGFFEAGKAYFWWFDVVPNDYVFLELPAGSNYPYATLDDPRSFNREDADVVLGYVRADALRYRQLRDRFTIEYTPTVGVGGPTVPANILYYIGMNSSQRLTWLYSYNPSFLDAPDIMKQQVLQQKASAEVLDVTFDFMHTMMFGDTITSATAVITLESGTDANPSLMLDGAATHTARTVTQTIKGGIVGNIYRIAMSASTANSCVYVVEGLLAINNSPAVAPP